MYYTKIIYGKWTCSYDVSNIDVPPKNLRPEKLRSKFVTDRQTGRVTNLTHIHGYMCIIFQLNLFPQLALLAGGIASE